MNIWKFNVLGTPKVVTCQQPNVLPKKGKFFLIHSFILLNCTVLNVYRALGAYQNEEQFSLVAADRHLLTDALKPVFTENNVGNHSVAFKIHFCVTALHKLFWQWSGPMVSLQSLFKVGSCTPVPSIYLQVKLARCRRPKVACFLSYVEYKSNTNTSILWDTGHTKGRPHLKGIGQGKETKNLNVFYVLTVQEWI
jgi:hypothetical protein